MLLLLVGVFLVGRTLVGGGGSSSRESHVDIGIDSDILGGCEDIEGVDEGR